MATQKQPAKKAKSNHKAARAAAALGMIVKFNRFRDTCEEMRQLAGSAAFLIHRRDTWNYGPEGARDAIGEADLAAHSIVDALTREYARLVG